MRRDGDAGGRAQGGGYEAEACECQHERRMYQLRRLAPPQRYQGCTLDSYNYDHPGADPSLWKGTLGSCDEHDHWRHSKNRVEECSDRRRIGRGGASGWRARSNRFGR